MLKIRVGTRKSQLALAQVKEVNNILKRTYPNILFEVYPILTSGDKIQDRNLFDVGGKALFIKEIEDDLAQNKIDVAIHSAKDVPPFVNPKTTIISFTKRHDARDCFISSNYKSIDSLPAGSTIGTSSPRRKAILLKIRPDLKIIDFRGNIATRLEKLNNVDGSILSYCGLKRVDKVANVKEIISTDSFLPAGGQGSLAIQIRSGDSNISQIFRNANHDETEICIRAERSFLEELGASCFTPVATYGQINSQRQLNLKTILLDHDGGELFELSKSCAANLEDAVSLGKYMAKKTKKDAHLLVERICKNFS